MKDSSSQLPEGFYKSLFENTLDGLAYCQMFFDTQERPVDFVYLEVNSNFEKLTGLKGVRGKKVTELVPGINVSNPELFEIYGRVSSTGKPEIFETYVEPLARWLSVSAYSPQKGFFAAVFQNITDQKQTQKDLESAKMAAQNVLEDLQVEKEKLAEAKAKDEALLASIGEGLIAIDNDRKVLVMNKAAEDMLDLRARDIIGTVINYLPLTDAAGNILPLEKRPTYVAITTGKTVTTPTGSDTYFFVRQDETKFPIAITVTPVMLERKIAGAVVIFRDLTKEKEIEKLRMDFLSLASHQLRTPLSGTKWLIETIKRGVIGEMNERQNEYLGQIYQINERMIKLVSDMLSVLRLENTVTAVQKKVIRVSELFQDLQISLGAAAKSQDIILRYPLDHRTLTIETDPEILKSILECFLSNAINYSAPGREVATDVKEETAAIVFLVKDRGIGIPKEEQKRIFERFYRGSNAKIFKPEGTGLGLYIASALAEKIGSVVSFESEEGKGSTFYLRVPKTKVD